jgi:tRNA pseudouridine38-40 synthase
MTQASVQLVLQYDGAGFAGWQRQPGIRTVQGVMEEALQRLCGAPIVVTGAGRTDAGVHARGQAAGASVPEKWNAPTLARALNAVLPKDVFVSEAFSMHPEFHPRRSAISRAYSFHIGLDPATRSPFRNRYEWHVAHEVDTNTLAALAGQLEGQHCFRAFAVQGTAPAHDDHVCIVSRAAWKVDTRRIIFEIEANRFLHHMVRFLVGTMIDMATGRRPADLFAAMLGSSTNRGVSPPAPPHGLFLERVRYPALLYLDGAADTGRPPREAPG